MPPFSLPLTSLRLLVRLTLGLATISCLFGQATIMGVPVVTTAVGASAGLDNPSAVAFDTVGNMYIADTLRHAIRKVSAAAGAVTTVAGNGTAGGSGEGGPATLAGLNAPHDIKLDAPATYISRIAAVDAYASSTRNLLPSRCSALRFSPARSGLSPAPD